MSDQILAKHPSQLSLNAVPLQKLLMDLSESDEECLSGGERLETLKKLQEEFQAELSRSSSSDLLFILIG
ncbi:MAG: hypothetical protein AB1589_07885 [Cyanobacteriota bacterium]